MYIAEHENCESGNVLLNFNTCEVSVLYFFLNLQNKDSCSYVPKIRVTGEKLPWYELQSEGQRDQVGHDCNMRHVNFLRLFKKQSKDLSLVHQTTSEPCFTDNRVLCSSVPRTSSGRRQSPFGRQSFPDDQKRACRPESNQT